MSNTNPSQRRRHWFRSRFPAGFGWGLPLTWEGWVVYALAVAGFVAAYFLHPLGSAAFYLHLGIVIVLLLLVCWRKGEPPGRWQDFPRRSRGRRWRE